MQKQDSRFGSGLWGVVRSFFIAVSCMTGLVAETRADYVRLQKTDGQSEFSVQSGKNFDGQPISAGKDYLISNGLQGRTPSSDMTFVGRSLTIGEPDGSLVGSLLLKAVSATGFVAADLRLARGFLYGGTNGELGLAGSATVLASADDPFGFSPQLAERSIRISSVLNGDVGTGLKTVAPGTVTVAANNSGTYSGAWRVGAGSTFITATGRNGLGKPLAVLDGSALVLEAGAIFVSETASVYPASDNRGVEVPAAATMTFESDTEWGWPVSGEGSVEKRGAGRLWVSGMWAVPLTVVEGDVAVKTRVPALSETGYVPPHLTFGTDPQEPIEVLVDPPAVPEYPQEVVLATFSGMSRSLTLQDFNVQGADLEILSLAVEEDSGTVSLKASLRTYVRSSVSYEGKTVNLLTGACWENGRTPQQGDLYLCYNATDCRVNGSTSGMSYDYPGDALALYAPGATAGKSYFASKYDRVNFKTLIMTGWTGFVCGGSPSGMHVLTGGVVRINSTEEAPVQFRGAAGRTCSVDAPLQGRGAVEICGGGKYDFTRDNSRFSGAWKVTGGAPDALSSLRVFCEKNLGQAPASQTPNAVEIGQYGVLEAGASCGLFDQTRGLTFSDASATIRVGEGLSFTSTVPVDISSSVTKDGLGTWAIGGQGIVSKSSPKLILKEGKLKILTAYATGEAVPEVHDGFSFVIARTDDPTDDLYQWGWRCTKSAVSFKGAQVRFELDPDTAPTGNDEFKWPMITVQQTRADALEPKIKIVARKMRTRLVREDTDVGGAHLTVFSAWCTPNPGLILVVR